MKSDLHIQHDVQDQIMWEPILNPAQIGVAVKDGIVTLSGIVDTYAKKLAAEKAAKKVAGVKAVALDLQVGISPLYRKTDSELADAVIHALSMNVSVPQEAIQVKVDDGIVTLDGEVDWDYQRAAAKTAIEGLIGIKAVNNNLTIKPMLSSENISRKISEALHRSATIDAQRISVEVIGTKAVLKGKVRSFAERDDAEDAAWAAPGITSVENKLDLESEEILTF
ncbi:BON domain-containing protein [Flavisolibacter tropicus]|uniref:Ornithine aminotransferase n=1 Tax=Flavisolibacter tropicus TaxID=1492898 RepID=A0A172TRZ7_9BACT|nr:BON domain-containing protein [Flavisolibacter tropicus]ANE49567.1 ornithine aminotransferase [Flavisolibacter tropicus]